MGSLSMVFYLIIYILNLTSLMYMLLTVRNDDTIKNVIEFMVIKHNNYSLIILLALNFLSLAGIPPLLGFLPKLFLFIALGDLGLSFGIFYMLLMSVLMAISYSRIIRFLIIDEKWRDVDCVRYRRYFMFCLILYFIILIGILMVSPTPIITSIF